MVRNVQSKQPHSCSSNHAGPELSAGLTLSAQPCVHKHSKRLLVLCVAEQSTAACAGLCHLIISTSGQLQTCQLAFQVVARPTAWGLLSWTFKSCSISSSHCSLPHCLALGKLLEACQTVSPDCCLRRCRFRWFWLAEAASSELHCQTTVHGVRKLTIFEATAHQCSSFHVRLDLHGYHLVSTCRGNVMQPSFCEPCKVAHDCTVLAKSISPLPIAAQ